MNSGDVWYYTLALTLATLLSRLPFFLFGHGLKIPPRIARALGYAPVAAMAAIIVPILLDSGPAVEPHWFTPKVLAGVGGAVIFLLTRHMLGTIVAGMVLYTALRLYL